LVHGQVGSLDELVRLDPLEHLPQRLLRVPLPVESLAAGAGAVGPERHDRRPPRTVPPSVARASIAVATNSPFSEWNRTFTDPRLCAAVIDRLTFNALIIETGTDSYRLRQTHP
jgi:hypothetical protein